MKNKFINNQKGFAPIIIALIVAVFLGGGYFIVKQKTISPPNIVDAAVSLATATNNQKIYKNEKYGFEIQFPTNLWDLSDLSETDIVIIDHSLDEASIHKYDNLPVIGKLTDVTKQISIDGKLGYQFDLVSSVNYKIHGFMVSLDNDHYLEVSENSKRPKLSKDAWALIISTFKFASPSATTKTDVTFSVSGNNLSVVNNGKVIQTVSSLDKSKAGKLAFGGSNPSSIPSFITDQDVNFDGHNDVGALSGSGYGGVNYFYDFYIFNPTTEKLEKNSLLAGIVPVRIDPVKKQIISTYKSGPGYVTDTYQWNGSTFIKSGPIQEIKENETANWKTYKNEKYGFEVEYPTGTQIDLSDTSSKKVGFQPITTKGNLSIDVIQSSANCFDTASGIDPAYKMIGGINFIVWNESKGYSTGLNTWATARRYCISRNGYEYNIITKLPYKAGTTPLDVDKDAVLNQILSTFKFTTPSITVIFPNGGETFKQNSPITVKWSQNFSAYASICLMGDAGCVYNSTPVLFNSGVNTWTIPANTKVTTCTEVPSYRCYIADGYKVRVTTDNQHGSGHAGEFMNDQSDNYFTISSN